MLNLGFEHKGKYIDENRIFPIYEHYLNDVMCKVTISSTKRIKDGESEAMPHPNMEMVIAFDRIFSKKDQEIFFYKYINTETDTKESINEIIESTKERYKKEHY